MEMANGKESLNAYLLPRLDILIENCIQFNLMSLRILFFLFSEQPRKKWSFRKIFEAQSDTVQWNTFT